jgi:hypothetical protein
MVVTDGFEPSISGLSARRSDQLSYATIKGEGGGTCTRSSGLIQITQRDRLGCPNKWGRWIRGALMFKLPPLKDGRVSWRRSGLSPRPGFRRISRQDNRRPFGPKVRSETGAVRRPAGAEAKPGRRTEPAGATPPWHQGIDHGSRGSGKGWGSWPCGTRTRAKPL